MREDLLGYLLSALEPHEMRRVEQELRSQPALREELEYLQRTLEPLDRAMGELPVIETPPDLVSRTMAMLPEMQFGQPATVSVAMAPVVEERRSNRNTWSDLLVATLASVALLGLLFPSIARGRYQARKTACQDHLRQLGTAITQFVLQDHHESLPQIAESGSEAFAGMYAVRLAEHDLLQEAELKWCPEMAMPSTDVPIAADHLVKLEDLRKTVKRGDVNKLRWLQQTAGGHYAYTLGVVDGDRYRAPHYEGRSTFAILGDSPISGTEIAEGVDAQKLRWGHGDSGANLLFEDGSVRFLDMARSMDFPDHPFFNQRGAFEAGVNIDDASLAPSWRAPFINVRQR
jgi:hypothetical protein